MRALEISMWKSEVGGQSKSQLLSQAKDKNSFSMFVLMIENAQMDMQSMIPSLSLKRRSVNLTNILLMCFSSSEQAFQASRRGRPGS